MVPALITCLLSAAGIWTGLHLFHSGWAAILLYHAVLLGAMVLGKPPGNPALILRGFNIRWIFGLVLVSAVLGWIFYAFVHEVDPRGTHVLRLLSRAGLTTASLIPFLVYTSTINPILEECYWRRNYAEPGGWFLDVFYALLHIPIFCFFVRVPPLQLIFPVAGLVLAGTLWRFAARRAGGLAAPIIGHGTGDFAMLAVIALVTG